MRCRRYERSSSHPSRECHRFLAWIVDTSASKENVSQFEPVEEVTVRYRFRVWQPPSQAWCLTRFARLQKGPALHRTPSFFHRFSFILHLLSSSIPVQLGRRWIAQRGYISFAGVCLRKTRSALSADVSKFCNLISTRLFPEEDDWSSLKDDGQW